MAKSKAPFLIAALPYFEHYLQFFVLACNCKLSGIQYSVYFYKNIKDRTTNQQNKKPLKTKHHKKSKWKLRTWKWDFRKETNPGGRSSHFCMQTFSIWKCGRLRIGFEEFCTFERMRISGGTKTLKELETKTLYLLLQPISGRLRFDYYRDSKIRSAGIIYVCHIS